MYAERRHVLFLQDKSKHLECRMITVTCIGFVCKKYVLTISNNYLWMGYSIIIEIQGESEFPSV